MRKKYTRKDIIFLSSVLYDSQFKYKDVDDVDIKEEKFILPISRPDFNRYKHVKHFFIISTFVYETRSRLIFNNVLKVIVTKKDFGHFGRFSSQTVYGIQEFKKNVLNIETEEMEIKIIMKNIEIEIEDIEYTNNVYLRISGWKDFDNNGILR